MTFWPMNEPQRESLLNEQTKQNTSFIHIQTKLFECIGFEPK